MQSALSPLLLAGEVDMKRAFPRGWVAYRDQIWCVLTYMKKLFYQIETDSALNIDAASLYERRSCASWFSILIADVC